MKARLLLLASLFFIEGATVSAQKQIKLSDSLLANSTVYECKAKSGFSRSPLIPFPFSDYKISDLRDKWRTSSYWNVYLKDKEGEGGTVKTRTGFSFLFNNSDGDTADVAVFFRRIHLQEGLTITSTRDRSKIVEEDYSIESFTAHIKTNKDTSNWHLEIQLDKKGPFKFASNGILTNGRDTIRAECIQRWDDNKKPIVAGMFNLGTEFFIKNEPIAAVQYGELAKRKVWLSNRIDDQLRFVLATVIEALLIESEEVKIGE